MQDEPKTKEQLLAELGELRRRLEQTQDLLARCRKTEEALYLERDFSSALLDTVGAMVVVVDREGRIVRFNRACEQITGYTFAEAVNKPYDIGILPEDADRAKAAFQELLQGHLPSFHENHVVTKEGKRRLIAWSNTALFKDGQVEFVVGTGIDITERKEAERHIAHLASFPQLNPSPVLEVDFSGRVTFYNAATLKALETLGLPGLIEAFLPEDLQSILDESQETGQALFQREVWIGNAIFAEAISLPADVQAARIYAWDISKLKQTEEALRQSDEKFRLIAETIQDVFWLSNSSLDQMIYVSPAYEELWGRSRESLYAAPQSFLEVVHPEDRERVVAKISEGHSQGIPWNHEYRLVRSDGSSRWVQDRGFPIKDAQENLSFVTGVATDISERKRMEEALRDNEQFLSEIFNHIQDGLSILAPDFTIIRVNPAMEKFGYAQPIVGRKCYEVYHGRSAPCEVCPSQQTFLTGKAGIEIVTEHLADGADRFMEIQAFPLLDRTSGQVKAVIEYVRNLTELRRAEADRQQFGRLESLGLLAGGIAHDFNNIFTAILGNISLARLDGTLSKPGRERLVEAEQACMQAQGLSRQLLTFAKGGAPIKKVASLVTLLQESVRLALAGSNSLCEFSLPDNLWLVEIDAGQINQVLNNLLINADQAMPGGGKIKIEAENIVVEEGTDLALPPGNYVKLAINDQGTGIPGTYLDKIFDPYFTTKQKGSGLGLATAYSIITNHSGQIRVKSQLEVGTTFEIYLPAKEGGILAASEETATPIFGQGKVLVMDDDSKVREVLCRMLGRLGYQTDSAGDGAQALEKFIEAKQSGQTFAVVILGLTVPGGMGGQETMEKLLRIDPQVKAIVSSGYADDPVMADFQKYGFSGVIPKPPRLEELGRVLRNVIKCMN